jgi:hypothetical protein
MDKFKEMLEKQMKKASASVVPPKKAPSSAVVQPTFAKNMGAPSVSNSEVEVLENLSEPINKKQTFKTPAKKLGNVNRVTVNLFEADRRALAVIKELLSTEGHDFTSRSDSIKVALRLASKAKSAELGKIYNLVKIEDKRFKIEDV